MCDGHGPSGHKVAHYIRDRLPSKVSASLKQRHLDTGTGDPPDRDNHGPLYSLVKASLIQSFDIMDQDLEADHMIDTYCSGATTVSVLRKVYSFCICIS